MNNIFLVGAFVCISSFALAVPHKSTFTTSFCHALAQKSKIQVDVQLCVSTGLLDAREGGDPTDPYTGKILFSYTGQLTTNGRHVKCLADRYDSGSWEIGRCVYGSKQ